MENTTYALPATPKQIAYAHALALRNQTLLPWEVQQDRRSLSAWIDAQAKLKSGAQDSRPTSKQVAFAERLARIKTPCRAGRVFPRQGADVEMDRREQVTLGRPSGDRDYFSRSTTDAPPDLASAIRLDWILDVKTELNEPMGVRSSQT